MNNKNEFVNLKEIEFENFKGFKKKTTLKISPMTLLSGKNGAGKSTIAQILLLIKQSASVNFLFEDSEIPSLKLNGELIKLGELTDVVNDPEKNLYFKFTFDDNTKISFFFKPIKVYQIPSLRKKGKNLLELESFRFENKDSALLLQHSADAWDVDALKSLEFSDLDFKNLLKSFFNEMFEGKENYKFDEVINESLQFTKIKDLSFVGLFLHSIHIKFDDIKNCISEKYIDTFSVSKFKKYVKDKVEKNDIELRFGFSHCVKYLDTLKSVKYFEPFRGLPKRVYDGADDNNPLEILDRSTSENVEYRFDFTTNKIVSGSIKQAMHYWLNEQFELADGYEINELVENLISEAIIYENGKKITLNNVGFGVSQILPLISGILLTKNSIIIVDEPECHLHPGLQSKIGEFLLNMCMLKKTIIIETHSEHIINALTYFSLKYDVVANLVKSYWVFKNPNKETSCIKEIIYDDYGFPQNAPKGFYDEIENIVQALNEIRAKKMLG